MAAAKRIEQEKLITSSGKLCVFRLEWAKKGEKEGIYRGKLEVRTPVRRKTLIGFYMICPGAKLLGGFSLKCVNNWPTISSTVGELYNSSFFMAHKSFEMKVMRK